MDGQPPSLLFSVHVVYHIPPIAGAENRGRGYGTECARALVSLGFRELGFHRLEAHVNLDNPASQRVLTKAGFVREGIRKAFIFENGVWTDNLIYTIIAPDGAESEDACGA